MSTWFRIYTLSAIAVMQNAQLGEDGVYRFYLSESAVKKCVAHGAPDVQEPCPLFDQILYQQYPNGILQNGIMEQLSDILLFMDFSRIFDRTYRQKKYLDRQAKARDMFRPRGITLDFGYGSYRYMAFERSASMSRNARIAFIREDFYEPIRKRIMLDMDIGLCQLSKLYAYNGLMLTSGTRMDGYIFDPNRVVVVKNPRVLTDYMTVVTVEDDGTENAVRKYTRCEEAQQLEIQHFDGEGLISREYAAWIDRMYCGVHVHTSFQIRMPYIKGVVHEVDFRAMFLELGADHVTDYWGVDHPIQDVDLILTESMFKGLGWMTDAGLSFPEFLARCKAYRHGLYISETSQPFAVPFTELNYQFLNTAAIENEQFRPGDLPPGWTHDPNDDVRHWITKTTEIEYYRNVADESFRVDRYTKAGYPEGSMGWHRAQLLKRNPLFIREKPFCEAYEKRAESILNSYARGNLYAAGDNRYLSDDLLLLIRYLVHDQVDDVTKVDLARETLKEGEFYAPGFTYYRNEKFTLLRNPHIARNEETVARCPEEIGYYRQKYLSHLTYVVMVNAESLIPERLGGADYDGDMIKTIADPLLNKCIARTYSGGGTSFDTHETILPVLKIPAAKPLLRDANDWEARFETIRSTFDSRIGQICNAAFNRSVIAYDESLDPEARQQLMEEVETLEILVGLEIDSAKAGIKPDLDEYLKQQEISRSPFLKYRDIMADKGQRAWYEPTQQDQLDEYFAATDWDSVTSNVERLPYYAKLLKENTPKLRLKPAKDEELFSFCRKKDWKKRIDPRDLDLVRSVVSDYDSAQRRIRLLRVKRKDLQRRSDVERILFRRGQEDRYSADELYGVFQQYSAREIAHYRSKLQEKQWHLLNEEGRELFLLTALPYEYHARYLDVFADFRENGYRLLLDILSDYDDLYHAEATKENARRRDTDSDLMQRIMDRYDRERPVDYRRMVAEETRQYLVERMDRRIALQCAVALKRRDFAIEVLPDAMVSLAVRGGKLRAQ